MSRRRGVMSESFKNELAKDLGFYDVVQREGWEGIRTKDAGNMVKRAIQIAQETLVKQHAAAAPAAQAGYRQPYQYQQAPVSAPQPNAQRNYSQSSYGGYPTHSTYSTQAGSSLHQPQAGWMGTGAASQQGSQAEQRPYYS